MRLFNKYNKTISQEAAKDFCKAIKYYDKIEFVDGCEYTIKYLEKKEIKYTSFEEAVAASIKHSADLANRGGTICISVYNPNFQYISTTDYIDKDIFELREASVKCAKYRDIYISPSYDRIYMECFEVFYSENISNTLSYDYELMYGDPPELKLNTPYISLFTDFRSECYIYPYASYKKYPYYYCGKNKTKVRNPFFITEVEMDNIRNTKYRGDHLYYGVLGYYQISTAGGLIFDWDEATFDRIVPIASIVEYQEKRPKIQGITRYKVHMILSVYDNDEKTDCFAYVDCATGDIETAKKEAMDNHWNGEVEVDYVEIVPDGEWVI